MDFHGSEWALFEPSSRGSGLQPDAGVWRFSVRGGGTRAVPVWMRPGIPTGFRPKAQGCEARATLGNGRPRAQPQRGCVSIPDKSFIPFGPVFAQKRPQLVLVDVNNLWRLEHRFPFVLGRNPVGVAVIAVHLPRVARASQPWALRRNPFGISSQ